MGNDFTTNPASSKHAGPQASRARRMTVPSNSRGLVRSRARTPMRVTPPRGRVEPLKKHAVDPVKIVIKPAEVVPPKTEPEHTASKAQKSSASEPPKVSAALPKDTTKNSKQRKKMQLPRVRKLHFKIRYVVLAILLLLLTGFIGRVAIWEHNYLLAMEGSERHTVENTEDPAPDETVGTEKPTETEIYEYKVAPDKPRYFSIPILGIRNARILEIGVNANGELGTPYSIYDIGWYNASSLPGNLGVSVLDGHGGYLGGIFKALPNISLGDEIRIEMGDGRTFSYAVSNIVTKSIGAEANSYMRTAMTPTEGKDTLVIITCTGEYYQTSKTFSHRLFVHATRVN